MKKQLLSILTLVLLIGVLIVACQPGEGIQADQQTNPLEVALPEGMPSVVGDEPVFLGDEFQPRGTTFKAYDDINGYYIIANYPANIRRIVEEGNGNIRISSASSSCFACDCSKGGSCTVFYSGNSAGCSAYGQCAGSCRLKTCVDATSSRLESTLVGYVDLAQGVSFGNSISTDLGPFHLHKYLQVSELSLPLSILDVEMDKALVDQFVKNQEKAFSTSIGFAKKDSSWYPINFYGHQLYKKIANEKAEAYLVANFPARLSEIRQVRLSGTVTCECKGGTTGCDKTTTGDITACTPNGCGNCRLKVSFD